MAKRFIMKKGVHQLLLGAIVAASLAACGGGDGSAGTGSGSIDPGTGNNTAATLSIAGITGSASGANGNQPISNVTASVNVNNNISSTTLAATIGGTLEGSLTATFETNSGNISGIQLQLGVAGQSSFLSVSCNPCTDATVNVNGRALQLNDTPLSNNAGVVARLTGTIRY
jgi:ribosomal protein S27E